MATVKEHYHRVLSEVYSWMMGGFDVVIGRNTGFMARHNLRPGGSGIAVDLGSGCPKVSIENFACQRIGSIRN